MSRGENTGPAFEATVPIFKRRAGDHTGTPRRRLFVFADESGNLDFSSRRDASRYFLLATVTMDSCAVAADLLEFRRQLAWKGIGLCSEFHATTNSTEIRNLVFERILKHPFTVDATVFEKSKVAETYRTCHERFYEFAWHWHMAQVANEIVQRGDELFVVSASIATNKQRQRFFESVTRAVKGHTSGVTVRTAHWKDDSDPCLAVADYCAWAIYRKWEMLAPHYYCLIKSRVRTELNFFAEYGPQKANGRS